MLQYFPSGDTALIIKVGNETSLEINHKIRALLTKIEKENIPGVIDFIPSYNELMICYNPLKISFQGLLTKIKFLSNNLELLSLPPSSTIVIPVHYGDDFGPDLNEVASYNNLSPDEVVRIHSSASYHVYMLGFTPGFCYLGGMDQRLATPRKHNPRLKIPAGAVGIAEQQTGIYPIESPGGWQLIGQTPVKLFDPSRKPVFLVEPGDKLQFVSITKETFNSILKEVSDGTYQIQITHETQTNKA